MTPDDAAGRGTGKIADLALGFGGSLGAWRRFDPDSDESDDEIKAHVTKWRSQHKAIERFWYALENAIKRSVRTGERTKLGNLAAEFIDGTLFITLPSGRKLAYPEAHLGPGKFANTTQVYFKDNAKGAWREMRGWYGTWAENVVQAISRDLLVGAMTRLEAAGYPVVLHCHDEAVAEVPDGFGSTDEFLRLMTTLPDWAKGLPVTAKAWTRKRYAKSELTAALPSQSEAPDSPSNRQALSRRAGPRGYFGRDRDRADARPDHRADRPWQSLLSVPRRHPAVLSHLPRPLSLFLVRRPRRPGRLAHEGRRSQLRRGRRDSRELDRPAFRGVAGGRRPHPEIRPALVG